MSRRNLFFFGGLATAVGAVTGLRLWMEHDDYGTRKKINREEEQAIHKWVPLDRSKTLENLAQTDEPYDLLIIGGGATGTGCALDAARRGLRVALIERGDFASGTSSKSTKLLHGGVRYLEKAALGFDREQLKLVREALSERLTIIRIAPHLSDQLAIMLPVYSNLWLPYYWLGAKAYDFLAGKQGLNPSYILGRKGVIEAFPAIKKKGLSGAIVYHDGVQDDARMNVSLALTAAFWGAHVINYVEAVDLIFSDEVQKENTEQLQKIAKIDTSEMKPVDSSEGELRLKGKVCGAVVIDRLTGKKFSIKARGVINATGPFCDAVRKMEDLNTRPMVNPSAGAHLILPSYYIPRKMGLIDPSSDDGRVLFLLPWEDASIAGTTETKVDDLNVEPCAQPEEKKLILDGIRRYIDEDTLSIRGEDIQAAWAGIRPLVSNFASKEQDTASLVRGHSIVESHGGLLTVTGGKWTTYRSMAEDTINIAIRVFGLKSAKSLTKNTMLIGSHGFSKNGHIALIQNFSLDEEVAVHLNQSYGDRAGIVAAIAHEISTDPKYYESIRLLYSNPSFALNYGRSNVDPVLSSEFGTAYHRLSSKHPYLLAEAIYAARFEMATCPVDVLARRTRLAHTDVRAAHLATPAVASALSIELGWDDDKRLAHIRETYEHLETCGMNLLAKHDCHSAFFKDGLAAFRAAAGPHWSPIERNEAVAILIQVLARHGQLCDGSKNASSGFLSGSSTLGESVGISEYMQVLRRALK